MLACQPTTPSSKEFEPEEVALSTEHPACANLAGVYSLAPNSPEHRVFSPDRQAVAQMDLVQITHERSNVFRYRLTMRKAHFEERVSAISRANPEAYAKWRSLITRWQREKQAGQIAQATERDILRLGPLPELEGTLTSSCKAFWNTVQTRRGEPVGLNAATEINTIETDTSLSRTRVCSDCTDGADHGALLIRYDNYRIKSGLFGGWARSRLLNQAYAKLNPAPATFLDWELNDEMLGALPDTHVEQAIKTPDPVPQMISSGTEQSDPDHLAERPQDLPDVLVDVQQTALVQLSENGSLSSFLVDEQAPNEAVHITMKGEAVRHREISDLLRALDQHEHVDSAELVMVRASEKRTYEFEIRLRLTR